MRTEQIGGFVDPAACRISRCRWAPPGAAMKRSWRAGVDPFEPAQNPMRIAKFLLVVLLFAPFTAVLAQDGPSVLIVTAHPDDDASFAATIHRITHELDGTADLVLITDGAGGYRFSTFSEDIYGLELTNQEVAEKHLPAIRKKELMAGGAIIGLRDYVFLDQPDKGKTFDADAVMANEWDVELVARVLDRVLAEGDYDFVFTMVPVPSTHAHHKAASIFALEAVDRMVAEDRPIVLGGGSQTVFPPEEFAFRMLEGHPLTTLSADHGPWGFNRNTKLGLDDRLNYNIIRNWLIAEHKSQGTMQGYMSLGDSWETFFLYEMNGPEAARAVQDLFDAVLDLD